MRLGKSWKKREGSKDLQWILSDTLKVSPIIARILINRGITSPEEAQDFINSGPSSLHPPFLLPDLSKALDRILMALQKGEKVVIYGDYDVDGVTATSLYLEFFKTLGKRVDYYIPDRIAEGYGLNLFAIQNLVNEGVQLLITADCGTTSVKEISWAQENGMDVIVTDHHQPPPETPPAYALINPHREDGEYPFTGLCAVGIAFKLVQGYFLKMENSRPALDERLIPYLDLVALGTIADVAPLRGENRFLVKEGLKVLSQTPRLGLDVLKKVCGVNNRPVNVGTVGFVLGPRINAGGRMANANEGVVLLTTSSAEEAQRAALYLNQQNQERQRIEAEILKEANEKIAAEVNFDKEKALVLASPRWHPGVIGIIASRLVERYYRPTIIISINPDGVGKGSARSIPSFHLYQGLLQCSELMEGFGGHKYAAGLTIRAEKIDSLREKFSSLVEKTLTPEELEPCLMIDAEVQLDDLNLQLTDELETLSPYGAANPEPVFMTRSLEPLFPRVVGKDHLKMRVQRGTLSCDAIGFQMGSVFSNLLRQEVRIDMAFSLIQDIWRGEKKLQLRIRDLRNPMGSVEEKRI